MKKEKNKYSSSKERARKRKYRFYTIVISSIVLFLLLLNFVIMPLTGAFPRVGSVDEYYGENPYIRIGKTPLISAHRAGGDLAPEETMKAFELCMAPEDYEVDIVEFDLHITKDEELVLMHDDTVDRTSNAREYFGQNNTRVKDKTLAELKELNFGENFETLDGGYPYRGLRGADIPVDVKILSLDEILNYLTSVREDDLNYIIEIKDGGKEGEKATDKLSEKMVEYDIVERTIVGTFHDNVTRYFDEKYPSLNRSASIMEVLDIYYAFLYGIEKEYKFDVLQIPKGIAIINLGTKAFIDYAHFHEISVQYWTINEAEDVSNLVSFGADVIITDNPEIAYQVINT